ncbi:MAG: hypothetical protein WC855_12905 [Thermodesulfovibrionales bacterium]
MKIVHENLIDIHQSPPLYFKPAIVVYAHKNILIILATRVFSIMNCFLEPLEIEKRSTAIVERHGR